jgi:protein-L-isoaspartate(D-aspartate) O-methyltransferase
MTEQQFAALREHMVLEIVAHTALLGEKLGKYNLDRRVMAAMGKVPRHDYVPIEIQPYAYLNRPLPIGFDKTISQPFIVALMTDALQLRAEDVVLEIGTGLGYQAAVLAELAHKVYSMEIIEALSQQAGKRLSRAGYKNLELKIANGYHGWPEHAPFDKVIVTAAPDLIPAPLIHQLKPGGRMVIPAGLPDSQQLILVEKAVDGRIQTKELLPVRFSQLEGVEQ